jgi:hypothetical protein
LQPQKQQNAYKLILLITRIALFSVNLIQENYLGALNLSLSCADNFLSLYITHRKKKRKRISKRKVHGDAANNEVTEPF